MPDPLRVLIIVPGFNEAQNLPGLLRALREVSPRSDICVVDDGSTDQTARVAREAGATVLRHPVNPGIAGPVQAGSPFAPTPHHPPHPHIYRPPPPHPA